MILRLALCAHIAVPCPANVAPPTAGHEGFWETIDSAGLAENLISRQQAIKHQQQQHDGDFVHVAAATAGIAPATSRNPREEKSFTIMREGVFQEDRTEESALALRSLDRKDFEVTQGYIDPRDYLRTLPGDESLYIQTIRASHGENLSTIEEQLHYIQGDLQFVTC